MSPWGSSCAMGMNSIIYIHLILEMHYTKYSNYLPFSFQEIKNVKVVMVYDDAQLTTINNNNKNPEHYFFTQSRRGVKTLQTREETLFFMISALKYNRKFKEKWRSIYLCTC